ncbi:hypothetical protein SELMODRAFT_100906 [Selaginella moellendorffii]|uniref:Chloride channel protein n=1 Tax=Selaginella moellendorffii TaxID=88036 RepID=D8RTA5_SELML|nr:putative chloride channel-like protein CLC-g [Selaginella moellendorffii]EFJ24475.1 hypothetical protein SELMODRAFT_100906 [Selaginella moellendorffii]|eukprot:XP_002974253.1 putative chloride channel-like protein CLC-g [Selaginella moellendorffii]
MESQGLALVDVERGDVNGTDFKEPLLPRKKSHFPVFATGNESVSFTGIIKSNVSSLESLDYEIVENDVFKQDWRARTNYEVLQYVIMKWTFACLIGVLTGLVALLINLAVENIAGAKLLITLKLLQSNRYVLAGLLLTGINLVLVLFSSVLCVYFGPAAAGSGIPEVKAYLNGIDAPEILAPNTLVVKILGSIGAVSAGLCVGKEGPLVHVGACIASLLGQGGSKRYHLRWKWLQVFKKDKDRRDLVTCGAAAGVAGAFKAPVGGVLFALEEASSWWRSSLLWRTFFTSAVVAVVLRIGSMLCKEGKCGLFGAGGLILFDVSDVVVGFSLLDFLPVVVLGVSGGIIGSIFNKLSSRTCVFYSHYLHKKGSVAKVMLACFVALVTSIFCLCLPALGHCRPCPHEALMANECPSYGRTGNFKKFNCEAGHYNDLASLLFTTNDDAIRNLFSTNTPQEYHYASVLIFLVETFLLTLMTYGIAVPSGLFIPVILNGASFGRLVGILMSSSHNLKLDEGLYAVLGAAAFLGGSMRMTVSLCVILLELTNNLSMLPLVMLVLLISKTVGDIFNKGLYDIHVRLKGFPLLESHSEPFMHQLTAADALKNPLVKMARVEKVGVIMDILRNTKHNAFPVIDFSSPPGKPVFCGLVLRSHLLVLLKHKAFQPRRDSSLDILKLFSGFDFAKPGSGKGMVIDNIEVSSEEEDMYIDMYPITNASPYTVLETMSLAKAYTLFRQLGLRHLCVMPKTPQDEPILGILTRHDFVPENLLTLYPYLKHRATKVPRLSSFLA